MLTGGLYFEFYTEEPLVAENPFRSQAPETAPLPKFESAQAQLPQPYWPANLPAIEAYWAAWKLAFQHLRKPGPPAEGVKGHIRNSIDTAFNECIFMWDSAFILEFARYGRAAFDFQATLDNLYAAQHPDGFITRELRPNGQDQWHRHDLSSTGPNLLAWSEWNHYLATRDRGRLQRVFPALAAYHRWTRRYRSWPDHTYFGNGLATGMDNMPRLEPGLEPMLDHGHMAWIDLTAQALLSATILDRMAGEIGRDAPEFKEEAETLRPIVSSMWNPETRFFADRYRDGRLSPVRQLGAFWALLAGAAQPDQAQGMAAQLFDPALFWRLHPAASMAADAEGYESQGGYWRGGVWAPTNYLTLRALSEMGLDAEAHRLAMRHHACVTEIYQQTGTFWENYAPDALTPGNPAKPDFVGWTGLTPIAILIEYLFGLRWDGEILIWDVRITDEFGVDRLPILDGWIDLRCAARNSPSDEPQIAARGAHPVDIRVRWNEGQNEKAIRSSV